MKYTALETSVIYATYCHVKQILGVYRSVSLNLQQSDVPVIIQPIKRQRSRVDCHWCTTYSGQRGGLSLTPFRYDCRESCKILAIIGYCGLTCVNHSHSLKLAFRLRTQVVESGSLFLFYRPVQIQIKRLSLSSSSA